MALKPIGSSRNRPYLRHESYGMGGRANTRLEHHVAQANERAETAIRVDGVQAIIWNRILLGSIPCLCRHSGKKASKGSGLGGLNPGEANEYSPVGLVDDGAGNSGRRSIKGLNPEVDNSYPANKDVPGEDDESWIFNGDNPAVTENKLRQDGEGNTVMDPRAINGDDDLPKDGSDLFSDIPTFLTSEAVACPVCLGSGYVDSWQMVGGRRKVMSFLDSDDFDTNGSFDSSAAPPQLRLDQGQYLNWKMKVPRLFDRMVRSSLCITENPHFLSLRGVHPSVKIGGTFLPATPQNMARLENNASAHDGRLEFKFVAPQRMTLTHFEMTMLSGDPFYMQMPNVSMPYEREFLEFNTNIAVEMSGRARVNPGDVICDSKYQSAWRVTNVVPRTTAGGKALVNQIDLRLVHSSEIYGKLNPWYTPAQGVSKLYRGINEEKQGGASRNGDKFGHKT